MAVIDLIIVGFACISLTVFLVTKKEVKQDVQVQREIDTGNRR